MEQLLRIWTMQRMNQIHMLFQSLWAFTIGWRALWISLQVLLSGGLLLIMKLTRSGTRRRKPVRSTTRVKDLSMGSKLQLAIQTWMKICCQDHLRFQASLTKATDPEF